MLCPLLTGMNGTEEIHVFCSSGESVSLSCKNAFSHCTSTTWNYNRHSETVELVARGIKKNNIDRHERLSLDSGCSLNINKVTKADYGFYTCRQYVNGKQGGTDALVYLHVLHVSVSSSFSQTKTRPGSSVTLYCQLDSYDESLCHYERIHLIWVNQAGVNLTTDSRYQISFSSTHCISTLTTTLLNEDHNREWICVVIQKNEVKTSATYTVKYPTPVETQTVTTVTSSKTATTINTPVTSTKDGSSKPKVSTTLILTTTKNSEKQTRPSPILSDELVSPTVIGIVAAAALAVLLSAVILCVICKKRADKIRGTNDSVVTNMNKYEGTNNTINISIHPTPSTNEQKEDVTYSEVATYSKIQAKKDKVNDEKVTYAAIRGVTVRP
ncbi:hypothetical protein QQF64_009851 [Cirrhinus molitorella]|uniref:Ig-like domain-containing protein n=1 Tax=Cirrhinus molitorella TaxID=172907 RepID=A0ABR3M5R5_9TELE